jgi:hypothetical protein
MVTDRNLFGAAMSQLQHRRPFVKDAAVREISTMSAAARATYRMIVASFVAGASLMAIVGIVGPVAVQGGLSVRDAMAATVESDGPVIEPLDVAAVQAQLAEADRSMQTARAATDGAIDRLDRLSH